MYTQTLPSLPVSTLYTDTSSVTGNIREYFEKYINEAKYVSRLRSETIRGYEAVFGLFLRIMPEITDIELLAPESMAEFFRRIDTRPRKVGKNIVIGVKKSTAKTHWAKLNVFFKWLYSKDYIAQNPLGGIKSPQVSYEDFKRLKDDEIGKIYAGITLHPINPLTTRRDVIIVSLLLYCGIRKGELVSLQVRDVDLDKKEITIRGETSKSKKTRIIPLHPTLVSHLKDYFGERRSKGLKTEHLIVSTKADTGLTRHGLKHWVNGMVEKSGIKFHLHQFRHTFACKLVEGNVHIFKIQRLMGHADIKMTMRYLRSLQTEDMSEDVGKITF